MRRVLLCAALIGGCDPAFDEKATGLALTEPTAGPKVMFDLDARPLPEIPFPNDLATKADPTSPTGRRLNLSLIGPTLFEGRVREKADRLDGFGVFAPIWVRFDAPIDAEALRERHRNRIVSDDAVYLLNIDPKSPGFGERVPLDLGYWAELPPALRATPEQRAPRTGRFPVALSRPDQYFPHDPRAGTASLAYETVDEHDADGDGVLDDAEDTDGDGVLDRQNVARGTPAAGSTEQADAILPFYETETNTLILRPVMPMREATRYAVVLSRFVTDMEGRPIQSPFVFVNHARQTQDLKPLVDALPQHGLNVEDVAFTWSFTTQTATRDLLDIRRGLYGHGPLGWLASEYPAELGEMWPWRSEASTTACERTGSRTCAPQQPGLLVEAMTLLSPLRPFIGELLGVEARDANAVVDSYRFVDYFVAGSFEAPNFLADRDGLAADGYPQDDDESFELDARAGTAEVGTTTVTYWCAIPKKLTYVEDGETKVHEPPFPVVLYGHGYGSNRLEMLGFAGHHARAGLATCALDAYGHGVMLPPDQLATVKPLLGTLFTRVGIDGELALGNISAGRARDLNNDGFPDSGGDFWTADTFHTRDILRQSAVDWLQFVRVLRSFDGTRTSAIDLDGDGRGGELAGDFNGDGVVDIGGPKNDYFGWGISLGGILSVLVPPIEPSMVAAAPTSGAAGLVDVATRSVQSAAVRVVALRMMGPLVLGEPVYDGETFTGRWRLEWMVPNTSPPARNPDEARIPIAEVALRDGDVVTVRNLTREANTLLEMPDRRFAVVREGQGFRVHFAADAWSATEKRAYMGFDPRAEGFQPVRMTSEQVLASGDRFVIEVFSAGETSKPREVVDTWAADTPWQGTVYPAGAPLVAPAEGMGHRRGSPDLRRFFNIAQAILDGGDPVAYAPLYFLRPYDQTDIEPDHPQETRAIVIPTIGDQEVPVNTGISMARAMGIIDFSKPRADLYGLTEDDYLLAVGAYEGTERYPRWVDGRGPYNFDVDDLDEMTDGFATDARGNGRLRLTKKTPGGGIAALRMPYNARSDGEGDTHGFDISQPSRAFDLGTFMANQISYFFARRGVGISRSQLDQRCLQYRGDDPRSCSFLPLYPED